MSQARHWSSSPSSCRCCCCCCSGMLDFGKAFNYWIDETHLANEGARWAAVNTNPGSGTLQAYVLRRPTRRSCETAAPARAGRRQGLHQLPHQLRDRYQRPVGDPVEVTVSTEYNWLPFLGAATRRPPTHDHRLRRPCGSRPSRPTTRRGARDDARTAALRVDGRARRRAGDGRALAAVLLLLHHPRAWTSATGSSTSATCRCRPTPPRWPRPADFRIPCTDQPILDRAADYAGIRSTTGTAPPTTPRWPNRQSSVHVMFNSRHLLQPDARPSTRPCARRPPCAAGMIDVKLTETDLPWFFGFGKRGAVHQRAGAGGDQAGADAGRRAPGRRAGRQPQLGPGRRRERVDRRHASPASRWSQAAPPAVSQYWDNGAAPLHVTMPNAPVGVRVTLERRHLDHLRRSLVACYDLRLDARPVVRPLVVEHRHRLRSCTTPTLHDCRLFRTRTSTAGGCTSA